MDVKNSSVKISETRVFDVSLCEDILLFDTTVFERQESQRGDRGGLRDQRQPQP